MTRISDLGELFDKSLKVLDAAMQDENEKTYHASEARARTAINVVQIYLAETRNLPNTK